MSSSSVSGLKSDFVWKNSPISGGVTSRGLVREGFRISFIPPIIIFAGSGDIQQKAKTINNGRHH
jgi:hypothetical protein